jgi:hypothetical protein
MTTYTLLAIAIGVPSVAYTTIKLLQALHRRRLRIRYRVKVMPRRKPEWEYSEREGRNTTRTPLHRNNGGAA